MFGDQVDVTYYDAALPEVKTQFADVLEQAASRYWPHPLVLFKGRVVMAGDVDAYGLSRLVAQELEQ